MDDHAEPYFVLLARIEIERRLDAHGNDIIWYRATDSGGDTPPLLEQLGMLAMATDTAWHIAREGDDD